jgi:hypothetical protein
LILDLYTGSELTRRLIGLDCLILLLALTVVGDVCVADGRLPTDTVTGQSVGIEDVSIFVDSHAVSSRVVPDTGDSSSNDDSLGECDVEDEEADDLKLNETGD